MSRLLFYQIRDAHYRRLLQCPLVTVILARNSCYSASSWSPVMFFMVLWPGFRVTCKLGHRPIRLSTVIYFEGDSTRNLRSVQLDIGLQVPRSLAGWRRAVRNNLWFHCVQQLSPSAYLFVPVIVLDRLLRTGKHTISDFHKFYTLQKKSVC